jgi:glycosyltransferase involved in cell wall biosynthesis
MKILHCIPSMVSGGAERQLTYLVAEQARQGDDVHVVMVHGGPNLPRLRSTNARIHFLRGRGNHDPALLWQLIRLMRTVRPDVVQTWLTQMDVLGGIAAAICRIPWVLSERSSALAYPFGVKNFLRAKVAAFARAIVVNSAGGDDYWRRRAVAASVRRYIPNPVPATDAGTDEAPGDELGLTGDRKMVLIVGRLVDYKNLANLLPALAIVRTRVQMTAFICGDGDTAGVRALIDQHDLHNDVRLLGYLPDVLPLMKRADAYVSVSRFEGRPNTVLEAVACGCPVIVSDIAAHREILDDEMAAFVSPDSPAQIAAAITATLEQPDVARSRAERARARASHATITEVANAYRSIYESILPRSSQVI